MSRYRPSRTSVSGDSTLDGDVTVDGDLDVTKNLEGVRRYLLDDGGDGLGWGGEVGETWDIYVNSSAGSDLNDGLSAAKPLKTLKKVLERIPTGIELYDSGGVLQAVSVHTTAGDYTLPLNFQAHNTAFYGATSSVDSGTWVTVSSSNADGSIIDATLVGTYAADELRGSLLEIGDNSFLPFRKAWIYANEATSGPTTRLSIAYSQGPANLPSTLTLTIKSLDTRFIIPPDAVNVNTSDPSIHYSSELTFWDINFDADPAAGPGTTLYNKCVQKVVYNGCKFGAPGSILKALHTNFGRISVTTCYSQMTTALLGGVQGSLYVESSVLDGKNQLIKALSAGALIVQGEVVFREANGLQVNGTTTYDTTPAIFRFLEVTGTVTCPSAISVNTLASDYYGAVVDLPEMYGAITGQYAVEARDGARVYYNPASSLSSSLGINMVSADGGISNVSTLSNLTFISGASPPFTGYEVQYSATTPGDWAAPAPTSSQGAIDRLAAAVEGLLGGAIP